jgi:very-short-patch-repair endonuclease
MDLTRSNAQALFMFLKEFTELRMRAVRSFEQYEDILWLSDIPQEDECECAAWHLGRDRGNRSDIWLEIQKPRLTSPPSPGPQLKPWLIADQISDSAREMPELRQEIAVPKDDSAADEEKFERLHIEDHPNIKKEWENYVEESWWPWAEVDRRRQKIFKVYRELYSIYTRQQKLGEQYEVVLGIGLLAWQSPDGHEIKRHLIAAQTSIEFEAARGVIRVSPAGEGARPCLEQDMVDPRHRPDPSLVTALESEVGETGDDIWDITKLQSILAGWANGASSRGVFDQTLARPERATADPIVHLSPAIILRRRSEHAYARVFAEIIRQIEDGADIPQGVRPFVTPVENLPVQHPDPPDILESDEIYFPLEANEEQRTIINRLKTHRGVLVQGPPGTGKSHTIVNLVCHLLALGKRVLVTSHTPRALNVLRRFFAERTPDIAPLCVVLLGDDRVSLGAMEISVQGIMDRHNQWDPNENIKSLESDQATLDEARKKEAQILNDLRAIRERETLHHSRMFGSYEGTLQAIGERLRREEGMYGWLEDRPIDRRPPPLVNDEIGELVSLLRDEAVSAAASWSHEAVNPEFLTAPSEFERLVNEQRDARKNFESKGIGQNHAAFKTLVGVDEDLRRQLRVRLEGLLKLIDNLSRHFHAFTRNLVTDVLADLDRPWRALLEEVNEQKLGIGDRARWFDQTSVTVPEGKDPHTVKADAEDALLHVERRRGWGMRITMPAPLKKALYLRDQVCIGGRRCDTPEAIRDLISWLDVQQRLQKLYRLWNPHAALSSKTAVKLIAESDDIATLVERALALHSDKGGLQSLIRAAPGLPEPTWHDAASIQDFLSAIIAADAAVILSGFEQRVEEIAVALKDLIREPAVDPETSRLLDAVNRRNVDDYPQAWGRIKRNWQVSQKLRRRQDLQSRLKASAPRFAGELIASPQETVWGERVKRFEEAWNWANARAWIERLSDPTEDLRLRLALDVEGKRMRDLLQRLAAARAWRHCFERMTPHQRQHLVAWSKAMRKIGKGTGKYVPLHRRAAREHMEECRGAIPAWIMPLYRVVESVRPGKDLFDVVIIDEASQSGPEALLLTYFAKKIVVVGDDKQISPEFVGLDKEDVVQLRTRRLSSIPHKDHYGADDSFFDVADIIYPGRIRLREHFRCMPEIIQFSNDLSYRSPPLIPLKQYGADRLRPVVGAEHVPEGYVKGSGSSVVNEPEAEKIVEYLRNCCHDQRYHGKSFGIISLLGPNQARLIERMLLEKVGPEEMERRQLTCGDAYAFQGDERDVIVLSMVSASGEGRRIGVLSRDTDQRRFNVAASRAREQMILFHSVTLADLNPQCLRYRFLDYCLHPKVSQREIGDLNLEYVKQIAQNIDRQHTSPPAPFESWFEVEVFFRIVDRGYRVIPQYEVAGYRIDLVVEGMENRLAVECDGDQWHGPEQYERDTARQRMLERCGWRFWRVRGSAFAVDPDGAMESLWRELEHSKVFPEGRDTRSRASDVVEDFAEPPDNTKSEQSQLAAAPKGGPSDRSVTPAHAKVIDFPGARDRTPPTSGGGRGQTGMTFPPPEKAPHDATAPQPLAYVAWQEEQLPDPRTASVEEMLPGLRKIIEVEGPMLAMRAFQLYARAAGLHRVRGATRSRLETTLALGVRQKSVLAEQEHGDSEPHQLIIRAPSSQNVIVRSRGPRDFWEIPPSEIAEVMRRVQASSIPLECEEVDRRVMEHYGLVRMTKQIVAELDRVREKFIRPIQAKSG